MRSTCCIRMCSSTVGVPRRPLLPALHIGVETAPRSAPSSKCTPLARAVRRLSHKRVVVVAGGDVLVVAGIPSAALEGSPIHFAARILRSRD